MASKSRRFIKTYFKDDEKTVALLLSESEEEDPGALRDRGLKIGVSLAKKELDESALPAGSKNLFESKILPAYKEDEAAIKKQKSGFAADQIGGEAKVPVTSRSVVD